MLDAYIYDGLRTPFGRLGGSLARTRPDDLLAGVIRSVIERSAFGQDRFDDIIIGCANQAGEDSRCVARHAGLLAGLPVELGGQVTQRNCGSGMSAIVSAAHAITCGEGELFLAGGVESMSRAPFVMAKAEAAFSREIKIYDSAVGARFPNPKIEKAFGADTMPETADNLAREYQISREEADMFALASQEKYAAAKADGFFTGEIASTTVTAGKGKSVTIAEDEHPRADSTLEALAALRPLHSGGVTTAGNASGVNDGAVAIIMGSRKAAEGKSCPAPIARILATATAGVPPRVMGIGPVPAIKKALDRAGLALKDMDVIEINEAFAAQVVACQRALELPAGDSRVNPNGGAIAVGHPLGASGPRIALTAARQLQRCNGKYAVISMCIGVGQGIALVLERI